MQVFRAVRLQNGQRDRGEELDQMGAGCADLREDILFTAAENKKRGFRDIDYGNAKDSLTSAHARVSLFSVRVCRLRVPRGGERAAVQSSWNGQQG